MKHCRNIVALLLCIIVVGIILRVDNIAGRTIGHIETYVPGIELPSEISEPRPRYGLLDYISRTIGEEPHPPAYYVFMFPWTKAFGTSLLSIRLPSVLFGVLSIILIYILCLYTEDKLTAILATGMLALNGLHIYWSLEAKFYIMACFLGILSTLLLVLCLKNDKHQKILKFLYLGVTLTGLSTVIFFWPIFLTQMLWVFLKNCRDKGTMPGILRFQLLIFLIGSPLWAVAAYQSRRQAYIEESPWMQLIHFFQFGFIFEPDPLPEASQTPLPIIVFIGMILLASFLFVVGIINKPKQQVETKGGNDWPPTYLMIIVGIICFFAILLFAKFAHAKDPSRTALIIATGCAPLILPFLDLGLKKYWNQLTSFKIDFTGKLSFMNNLNSLNTLLGIVPAFIIAVISFITPLFIARGVLAFVPYFLIILCRGLASLMRRSKLWVILLIAIGMIHGFGVKHWQARVHSPRNYKELYEKLEPKIQKSDLIFVYRNWAMTPIFYYLKEDRYRLVGKDYSQAIEENPNSRIWVLCLPGMPMKQEIKDALKGYQLQERVDAFNMWSLLYQKNP